jgi:regulator of protease activity HflC (stomatin/prohibitin superfamily)
VGSVVGLILAVVVLAWGIGTSVGRGEELLMRDGKAVRAPRLIRPGRLAGSLIAALAVYRIATASILVLPGAHIACIYDPLRGGIQDATIPEGLQFIAPWCRAQVFSVQTQEYTMSISPHEGAVLGDDSIKCETNEGLKVLLDVTVLFHIDPTTAPLLWRRLGPRYNEVFVRPVVRERIRMVVAKYSVQEVYSGRRAAVEKEITQELTTPFAEQGLALEQVLMRNVAYANEEFAGAIAEKQARQQQVITEKRNLERAEFEKSANINKAQGEARSVTLKAQTLSQNPEVARYELAQKIAPRVKRAYLSEDSVPLPRGGGR